MNEELCLGLLMYSVFWTVLSALGVVSFINQGQKDGLGSDGIVRDILLDHCLLLRVARVKKRLRLERARKAFASIHRATESKVFSKPAELSRSWRGPHSAHAIQSA
jgi:hypothetical protein